MKTFLRVVLSWSWHVFQQSFIGVKQDADSSSLAAISEGALQLKPATVPAASGCPSFADFRAAVRLFSSESGNHPPTKQVLLLSLEKLFPTEHNSKQSPSPTRYMCFKLSGNVCCVSPMPRDFAAYAGATTLLGMRDGGGNVSPPLPSSTVTGWVPLPKSGD